MKLRLFIAIDLPDSLRRTLSDTQEHLRRELKDIAIGWSRIEGIHLTLKFLGDVEESRVGEIGERMTKIAETWNPMQLELRAIGVFPSITRPRVLWCGIDGELERVSQLQAELEGGLEAIGFSPESRPFTPHLTLGRFRDRVGKGAQSVATLKSIVNERADWRVECFTASSTSLIKSELHPRGSIYTPLITTTFQS